MRKITLGRTGIEVTELCFGVLPIGPLQKDVPVEEASDTIAHGLLSGISFIDTAQMYKTYPHIRLALQKSGITPVICSKSGATTYEGMQSAVEEALSELGVNKLDIFLLHAARVNDEVLDERKDALKCLAEYREKGIIKAVGISTHVVEVVRRAAVHPDIDIVFALINEPGKAIIGGNRQEMEEAINTCHANNKGIMLMKLLAGGNLVSDYMEAMDYAVKLSAGRFALAIGMLNKQEVDMNVKYMLGEDITEELADAKAADKQFFIAKVVCNGCGHCITMCHSEAILMEEDGKAKIDQGKCLKCGYCVSACPRFSVRLI